MERNLAREMQKLKVVDEKKQREIEKACAESDELKELQQKIRAAYLNKERAAQMAENQFRMQKELVSNFKILTVVQEKDADIEIEMLRRKEMADRQAFQETVDKGNQMRENKAVVRNQMQDIEDRRQDARDQYLAERGQVDAIINKMIDEDHEMMRITKIK